MYNSMHEVSVEQGSMNGSRDWAVCSFVASDRLAHLEWASSNRMLSPGRRAMWWTAAKAMERQAEQAQQPAAGCGYQYWGCLSAGCHYTVV